VKADKVYLVGFMGAGKTTVARALGKRLDWKVEDIDERIERRERRDIPTIFRQDGEAYFRAIERQELIALLPQRGTVVATGGGTVVERVPLDGRRPLAADRIEMERLYNQRLMAYQQAHLRVDAGRGSAEDLVDQIVEWLGA
jgi:shikimate kinase